MYETKPYSGIRWIGEVQEIQPYEDTDKFEIILKRIEKLDNPLKFTDEDKKKGLAPRAPRYTKMELIRKSKNLRDVF